MPKCKGVRLELKKALQEQLLQKEMSRRQFLQFAGVAVISLFGLSNLLSLLTNLGDAKPKDKTERHGFGASKFGV